MRHYREEAARQSWLMTMTMIIIITLMYGPTQLHIVKAPIKIEMLTIKKDEIDLTQDIISVVIDAKNVYLSITPDTTLYKDKPENLLIVEKQYKELERKWYMNRKEISKAAQPIYSLKEIHLK